MRKISVQLTIIKVQAKILAKEPEDSSMKTLEAKNSPTFNQDKSLDFELDPVWDRVLLFDKE